MCVCVCVMGGCLEKLFLADIQHQRHVQPGIGILLLLRRAAWRAHNLAAAGVAGGVVIALERVVGGQIVPKHDLVAVLLLQVGLGLPDDRIADILPPNLRGKLCPLYFPLLLL